MTESKELQVKDKQAVAGPAEQTRPGVVFTPDVDIFEDERQITLLADMPGVASDGITIDLNDNVLSIAGEVKPFETASESDVLIEFEILPAQEFQMSADFRAVGVPLNKERIGQQAQQARDQMGVDPFVLQTIQQLCLDSAKFTGHFPPPAEFPAQTDQ